MCLSRVSLARDTWRQNIVHRNAVGVLFDIDSLHVHRTAAGIWVVDVVLVISHILIQALGVAAPFASNQIQCSQTQVCFLLEVGHIDTSKADRLEVTDIAHLLHHRTIASQWNLKLIPFHHRCFLVAQGDFCFHDTSNMLLTHTLHVFLAQGDMIAIESLAIIQGVILVDILDIWLQSRCCTICSIALHLWRVAFRSVVVFVTL